MKTFLIAGKHDKAGLFWRFDGWTAEERHAEQFHTMITASEACFKKFGFGWGADCQIVPARIARSGKLVVKGSL